MALRIIKPPHPGKLFVTLAPSGKAGEYSYWACNYSREVIEQTAGDFVGLDYNIFSNH